MKESDGSTLHNKALTHRDALREKPPWSGSSEHHRTPQTTPNPTNYVAVEPCHTPPWPPGLL